MEYQYFLGVSLVFILDSRQGVTEVWLLGVNMLCLLKKKQDIQILFYAVPA